MLTARRWNLAFEPYMLSILRIIVGLLYLEHGLNKLFDFPPTPTHNAYRLFTLVPGLAGLLELGRRRVDHCGILHASRCLRPRWRNGLCLFYGARA